MQEQVDVLKINYSVW